MDKEGLSAVIGQSDLPETAMSVIDITVAAACSEKNLGGEAVVIFIVVLGPLTITEAARQEEAARWRVVGILHTLATTLHPGWSAQPAGVQKLRTKQQRTYCSNKSKKGNNGKNIWQKVS